MELDQPVVEIEEEQGQSFGGGFPVEHWILSWLFHTPHIMSNPRFVLSVDMV